MSNTCRVFVSDSAKLLSLLGSVEHMVPPGDPDVARLGWGGGARGCSGGPLTWF